MPILKDNKVEVLPNTYWMMLLCTVRYAMGRQSYIVGEAVDLVLNSRQCLTGPQLEQIREEVSQELERYESVSKTLGHSMDHEEWKRLVTELEKT